MTKQEFIDGMIDIFELEDIVNEDTTIEIESLATLSIIAFFDMNFSVTLKSDDLSNVKTIKELMNLAGSDNLE